MVSSPLDSPRCTESVPRQTKARIFFQNDPIDRPMRNIGISRRVTKFVPPLVSPTLGLTLNLRRTMTILPFANGTAASI
jgi:hypothetical protein